MCFSWPPYSTDVGYSCVLNKQSNNSAIVEVILLTN